jgi:hypothetical protein
MPVRVGLFLLGTQDEFQACLFHPSVVYFRHMHDGLTGHRAAALDPVPVPSL